MTGEKMIYRFSEGNKEMKSLLGGKGANLSEMSRIGLPVPPGFIITTGACKLYFARERELWSELEQEVETNLQLLEQQTGRRLGGLAPLLLSVRSGAVVSMPGMMDTILNLGLNRETVEALTTETGNRRFALDCYRRFIQMFAGVVLNVKHYHFENILHEIKRRRKVSSDAALQPEDLEEAGDLFLKVVRRETNADFPTDPRRQLALAIKAVFDSWHTDRASVYRRNHRIPDDLGTAVNVQVMVFGNMGEDSATGVAFTRNPSTGEAGLYGEFLVNAQGEDVVAGIRTPRPLSDMEKYMPQLYRQFVEISRKLEAHYREMQDIEFTVERGKLYILQTRSGKRTAAAAVRVAVELAREGMISQKEALRRVDPGRLEQLLHRRIDPGAELEVIARGLPASPGAASGKVIFSADRAQAAAAREEKVLLVRPETTPDDIHGIIAAQGILTSRGGMTSHAAVVARGMGKPCVCGCDTLRIDQANNRFYIGDCAYPEGEVLSIDGSTGRVILGDVPLIEPELSPEFEELLSWADQVRRMKVRANADTPEDARRALEWGAEGIGLCRTEHMFMEKSRLPVVQRMILASTMAERRETLAELLPMQKDDFKGILREMAGYPVTIRLLDPPLHEFLPDRDVLLVEVDRLRRENADRGLLQQKEALLQKVRSLSEMNPMMGHRGCRLGMVYPEIYRMQVEAICLAAVELIQDGLNPGQLRLEIMIPLVGHSEELVRMKREVEQSAGRVFKEADLDLPYLIGTMIELPRACLVADQLAESAQFFSFGTNDLTQTTLGYSRDDAEGKFLPFYLQNKILKENPFMEIDREGVGQLVRIAIEKGRRSRPEIKLGICGEHGGDPVSVAFFHEAGLDYVSCSPYRVPIARLAAARASLEVGG